MKDATTHGYKNGHGSGTDLGMGLGMGLGWGWNGKERNGTTGVFCFC
jgi:hypothetical protein